LDIVFCYQRSSAFQKCMLLALFLLFGQFAQAGEGKRTYTVGLVPQYEASKLHSIWRPILDQLETATGEVFEISGAPSIPQFEKELVSGDFDFAYMNPYHFLLAHGGAGYTPLVRDHARKLFGILVVNAQSDITSPTQLDQKTIAFPAPNALGASLQMRQELVDLFGIEFTPRYVKTHDAVYLNVLLNEAAAGGGVQRTLNQQSEQYREHLRVIHTTQKVAPHPFAALGSVPDAVRKRVLSAFLAMGDDAEGKALLAKIPILQVGEASIDDYEPLRKLALERFYEAP